MAMERRGFLRAALGMGTLGAIGSPASDARAAEGAYLCHGRVEGYPDHRIIEPGRVVSRIETFLKGQLGIVRVTTSDGTQGYGQISTYNADLTTTVLHRDLARNVVGQDASRIDDIVDRCVEASYKYPWSYVCRALAGIDTAIWDLYGRVHGKPVFRLLGGRSGSLAPYGSSMRRDIGPDDEAARLARLRDSHGFSAFKIRVATPNGHDSDAAPGRTERLVPAVRKAVGESVKLKVDANSGYTPPRAIEVGRMLEQHGVSHYEEPCPYWELEWTAEVAAALSVPVAGGEQDNDLAQWRRMIRMDAVDVVQPDLCYVGGFTRALRVARMAEKTGKTVVPHSANLSLVTVFAMHLMAAIPNAGPHFEHTIEWSDAINAEARALYQPQIEVKAGRVAIPEAPGWGVVIDPSWLASATRQVTERS
jgi:L-alanine-DL-glutamate epimerase-like enolase superfamily enzyme